ncbi:hypothetical protein I3843_02G138200 [Carya illinoinensis]|nr:hypothetical protein I3843_02G138200 [Carya illinoinensis]
MATLQLRPKHRTLHNTALVNLFSTFSTRPDPTTADKSPSSTSSQSQSSCFSDVKGSLKQQPHQRPTSPFSPRNPTSPSKPFNPSFSKPSQVASLKEIRKNDSEFRLRSSVPTPTGPNSTSPHLSSSSQHIPFQELYKRYVIDKAHENGTNTASGPGKIGGSGKPTFEVIRERLRQLRSSSGMVQNERRGADPVSLSDFKNSLKLKPSTDSGPVIGGSGILPVSVFGKERERKETERETLTMKTEFAKMYNFGELRERLRPEGNKEGKALFSFAELKERLVTLREMEEKETESRIGRVSFKNLRESLLMLSLRLSLRASDDMKAEKSAMAQLKTMFKH